MKPPSLEQQELERLMRNADNAWRDLPSDTNAAMRFDEEARALRSALRALVAALPKCGCGAVATHDGPGYDPFFLCEPCGREYLREEGIEAIATIEPLEWCAALRTAMRAMGEEG